MCVSTSRSRWGGSFSGGWLVCQFEMEIDVMTVVQSFQIVKTQQILLVSRGKENMKRFMRCHLVLIQQLGTAFEARGKREVVGGPNAGWHHADMICTGSDTSKLQCRVTVCNCSIKALWCATIISTHQKRESKGSLMRVCCAAPLSRRLLAHSVIMEMECLYL